MCDLCERHGGKGGWLADGWSSFCFFSHVLFRLGVPVLLGIDANCTFGRESWDSCLGDISSDFSPNLHAVDVRTRIACTPFVLDSTFSSFASTDFAARPHAWTATDHTRKTIDYLGHIGSVVFHSQSVGWFPWVAVHSLELDHVPLSGIVTIPIAQQENAIFKQKIGGPANDAIMFKLLVDLPFVPYEVRRFYYPLLYP